MQNSWKFLNWLSQSMSQLSPPPCNTFSNAFWVGKGCHVQLKARKDTMPSTNKLKWRYYLFSFLLEYQYILWSNLMRFPFIFAVCWQVRYNRPYMPYWSEFNWKELCKIHPCFAKRGRTIEGEWEETNLKQVIVINSIRLFKIWKGIKEELCEEHQVLYFVNISCLLPRTIVF